MCFNKTVRKIVSKNKIVFILIALIAIIVLSALNML